MENNRISPEVKMWCDTFDYILISREVLQAWESDIEGMVIDNNFSKRKLRCMYIDMKRSLKEVEKK